MNRAIYFQPQIYFISPQRNRGSVSLRLCGLIANNAKSKNSANWKHPPHHPNVVSLDNARHVDGFDFPLLKSTFVATFARRLARFNLQKIGARHRLRHFIPPVEKYSHPPQNSFGIATAACIATHFGVRYKRRMAPNFCRRQTRANA